MHSFDRELNENLSDEQLSSTSVKRILVVDDEDPIRSLLRTLLEQEGYYVFDTDDGDGAFNMILAHGYIDLILLNLTMPKMSGFGFLDSLQDISPDKRPPVVILTGALLGDVQRKRLACLGVVDMIKKPFKIKTISETIRRILKPAE